MSTRFIKSHPKPLALAATGLTATSLLLSTMFGGEASSAAAHAVPGDQTATEPLGAMYSEGSASHNAAGVARTPLSTSAVALTGSSALSDQLEGGSPNGSGPNSITIQLPQSVTITFPSYSGGTPPSVAPPTVQGGQPPSVEQQPNGITVTYGSPPTAGAPTVNHGTPGSFTGPSACAEPGPCVG